MANLRYGDRVIIENLGIQGQVIEADTRTVVVRYKKKDGELVEHRFQPNELTYIPKPHQE
jgi:preprotein translocase subunit YajC